MVEDTIPFFYGQRGFRYMVHDKSIPSSLLSLPWGIIYFLPLVVITLYPTHVQAMLGTKFLIVSVTMIATIRLPKISQYHLPFLIVAGLYCSVLWSMSPPQSVHGAIQVTYYILLYTIFRYHRFRDADLVWGIRTLVLVALVLSLDDGLHQLLYGYEDSIQYLESMPDLPFLTTQQVARDWLIALSGRVFSRFALPSQLAGYLLMILPLNVFLLVRERTVMVKIGWGFVLFLNCLIFFYTKSFGAWLSLLGILIVSRFVSGIKKGGMAWRRVLAEGAGFLLGGWIILFVIGSIRGQYLWDLHGNNPLWFRFLNWKAAFSIFCDHPFLGTGVFTFGKLYPQYMVTGANESQFAHNSYLQIGSELGFLGIAVVGWLVGHWFVSAFNWQKASRASHDHPSTIYAQPYFDLRFFCFLSGLGFLLHNIVDFDVYVFPLGVLGFSLLALTLNASLSSMRKKHAHLAIRIPYRVSGVLLLLCGLLLMYAIDWQYTQGKRDQETTEIALQSSNYQEAYSLVQHAQHSTPTIPKYQAIYGSVLLYLQQPDAAIQQFEAAIRHEPITPWFHAGLAEAYLATQNIGLAYLESRRAAELFPQKSYYQERVAELSELFSAL